MTKVNRWKLKQHYKIIWQEAPEAVDEAVIVDLPVEAQVEAVEDQVDLPKEAQEVIKPFYEKPFSHPSFNFCA